MNRPLQRCGIQELEAHARVRDVSDAQLEVLESELLYRSSSRSDALLNDVRNARKFKETAVQICTKAAEKLSAQEKLRGILGAKSEMHAAESKPGLPAQVVPVKLPLMTDKASVSPWPKMTAEHAYQFLKVPPSAGWEQVESSRREIVARAQPDRLEGLSPEKRKVLQEESRLANAAYKSLLQR
jgi:hypothetical protein